MVVSILFRLCIIFGALYFFICSLSFLADGFRLVGGKGVGWHVENGLWVAPQRGSPRSWWLVIPPLGGATARQPGLLGRSRRALGLFRALERIARAAQITEIAMKGRGANASVCRRVSSLELPSPFSTLIFFPLFSPTPRRPRSSRTPRSSTTPWRARWWA